MFDWFRPKSAEDAIDGKIEVLSVGWFYFHFFGRGFAILNTWGGASKKKPPCIIDNVTFYEELSFGGCYTVSQGFSRGFTEKELEKSLIIMQSYREHYIVVTMLVC